MLKCVITDTFQVHKPIFGKIVSDHYHVTIPPWSFFCYYAITDSAEWLSIERLCVCVCVCVSVGARVSAGEHYRRVKRYAKCGIMVWHVWKWTQWLGLMTLWEPKVGIMSWKRHILDKPAGMVMEQTAGVRAQCWEISMLDLDLMDFISVHLRVMKRSDTAFHPTFLVLFCLSSVMLLVINHRLLMDFFLTLPSCTHL